MAVLILLTHYAFIRNSPFGLVAQAAFPGRYGRSLQWCSLLEYVPTVRSLIECSVHRRERYCTNCQVSCIASGLSVKSIWEPMSFDAKCAGCVGTYYISIPEWWWFIERTTTTSSVWKRLSYLLLGYGPRPKIKVWPYQITPTFTPIIDWWSTPLSYIYLMAEYAKNICGKFTVKCSVNFGKLEICEKIQLFYAFSVEHFKFPTTIPVLSWNWI